MTHNEFVRWWKDFAFRFPDAAKWLSDLDQKGGDPKHTLDAWGEALLDVGYDDALLASKALSSGEEQFPQYFKQEGYPALIRGIARRLAASRAPSRVDDQPGRRYECPLCLDTGRLEVVHWRLMQVLFAIFRGKAKSEVYWDCHYRTMTARCECRRGAPRGLTEDEANQKTGYKGPIELTARLNRDRHVLAPYGDTEDVDRIFAEARVVFERQHAKQQQEAF